MDVAFEGFLDTPAPPTLPDPLLPPPVMQVQGTMPPSTVLEFFLPGPFFEWREKGQTKHGRCPAPKGRGKIARIVPGKGFATVTDSPKTKAAELVLVDALRAHRPPKPFGIVRLDVDFVFVPPAKPKWAYEASLLGYIHVTSDNLGDRDNLHKLLGDAMQKAGFFELDSRITEGEVRKRWGKVPGYQIKLTALHEVSSFAEWKQIKASQPRAIKPKAHYTQ